MLPTGSMPDAEGFLRWASALEPGARGYWPCQGVATFALSGIGAIDTGVTAALGALHTRGHWNGELLESLWGSTRRRCPPSCLWEGSPGPSRSRTR